jgi:hypothetical protein
MAMRFLFTIAVGAAALLAQAALAQDRQQAPTVKVEIGGETISIPTPFGYCDLDPAEARDKLLIDGLDRLARQDRVLRRVSPCDELQAWRADKTHDPIEVVQFLSSSRLGDAGDGRRDFLRRAVPGDVLGKARVLERAGQGFPAGLAEGEFSTIGLIERTERAAIQAQAAVTRIDGKSQRLIAVTATTAIGPAPIVAQVLTPYDDGSELEWMVRDAREHVDRLLSASGETSQRFRDSRAPRPEDVPPGDVTTRKVRTPRDRTPGFFDANGGYIALGLVVGGALLIGIGLLVARRLRPVP